MSSWEPGGPDDIPPRRPKKAWVVVMAVLLIIGLVAYMLV